MLLWQFFVFDGLLLAATLTNGVEAVLAFVKLLSMFTGANDFLFAQATSFGFPNVILFDSVFCNNVEPGVSFGPTSLTISYRTRVRFIVSGDAFCAYHIGANSVLEHIPTAVAFAFFAVGFVHDHLMS